MDLRDKLKFWIMLSNYVDMIVRGTSPLSLPDAIANSLSYVKAFGGTEQRNLPDNYIERQFIYMMDGSYLLTDIVPTYDCKLEMDFQTTTIPSGAVSLLGGRTATYGGLFFAKSSGNVWFVDAFGTSSGARYDLSAPLSNNTRYKFTFNNKVATLESGGTTLFTNTFTGENANGAALAINGYNSAGSITGSTSGIYLYSFKAWNAQGELVADYVPAVQKGTVPVVGLYDTVSKTFKTATAGTFAAGGEAVPTPDAPMDIVSNNGVLKARHQSGLPLGYTLLEYIESTGTQYIDTGIVSDADTEVKTKALCAKNSGFLFGSRTSSAASDRYAFVGATDSSKYRSDYYSSSVTFDSVSSQISPFTVYKNKNVCSMTLYDGTTATVTNTSGAFTSTLNIYIFACNTNGTASINSGAKIYSFEIIKSGVTVFNGIPARRNSDNVLGMYDLVSGQFFTNAGTGDFVAGNPVSDPVEIYTDGTVETINVHSRNLFDINSDYAIAKPCQQQGSEHSFPNAIQTWANSLTYFFNVQPNTTYTYSCNTTGDRLGIFGLNSIVNPNDYTASGSLVFDTVFQSTLTSNIPAKKTFTTGANTQMVAIYCALNTRPTDIQIELGSTATAYEPYYDGGTATAEMLLKVGDYQDEFILEN